MSLRERSTRVRHCEGIARGNPVFCFLKIQKGWIATAMPRNDEPTIIIEVIYAAKNALLKVTKLCVKYLISVILLCYLKLLLQAQAEMLD